jgi:hypothetical protein
MSEDKPFNLPPAVTVAEMCQMRAWDDDTDDESRLVLEMAEQTIRALHRRLVRVSHSMEQAEATNDQLAGFVRVLGGQKGGAA